MIVVDFLSARDARAQLMNRLPREGIRAGNSWLFSNGEAGFRLVVSLQVKPALETYITRIPEAHDATDRRIVQASGALDLRRTIVAASKSVGLKREMNWGSDLESCMRVSLDSPSRRGYTCLRTSMRWCSTRTIRIPCSVGM